MRLYNGPSIEDVCNYRRPVIALAPGGEDIKTFEFPSRFILLPGEEGRGLPDSLDADHVLSIPIEPRVESLNATVAVSIALHAWYDSRR
jgi:TrmH family RNA methyltransferase/16S rRNA (guanine527-N7)-methyltransferase